MGNGAALKRQCSRPSSTLPPIRFATQHQTGNTTGMVVGIRCKTLYTLRPNNQERIRLSILRRNLRPDSTLSL